MNQPSIPPPPPGGPSSPPPNAPLGAPATGPAFAPGQSATAASPTPGAVGVAHRGAADAARPASLADTIRSEWIKIVTLRSAWLVPLLAAGLPLLVAVLTALFAPADSSGLGEGIFVMLFVPMVAVNAFSTTGVTSEYNHDTIRVTYAATPRRDRVFIAKYLTTVLYAVFTYLLIIAVCLAFGGLILLGRGGSNIISSDDLVRLGWGVFASGCMCAAALALGYLIRNSAGAVTMAAVYPVASLVLWGIVSASRFSGAAKWFPFSGAWSAAASGDDVNFNSHGSPMAFVYLAAVVTGVSLIAYFVERRRAA